MATEDFATWERNRMQAYGKHADEIKVMVAKHDEQLTLLRNLRRTEKLRRDIVANDGKPPEDAESYYEQLTLLGNLTKIERWDAKSHEEQVLSHLYDLAVIDKTIEFYRSRMLVGVPPTSPTGPAGPSYDKHINDMGAGVWGGTPHKCHIVDMQESSL